MLVRLHRETAVAVHSTLIPETVQGPIPDLGLGPGLFLFIQNLARGLGRVLILGQMFEADVNQDPDRCCNQ